MKKDQVHFTVERKKLKETHSDPLRDKSLGQCLIEVKVDPPEALMYVGEPTWKEVKEVV